MGNCCSLQSKDGALPTKDQRNVTFDSSNSENNEEKNKEADLQKMVYQK